jgi:hypothetical protein
MAACSAGGQDDALPECDPPSGALVLVAQAVPSASLVPCVEGLATGWTFRKLEARDGSALFALDSDRVGDRFLTVLLTESCDPAGPPDENRADGITRFQEEVPGGSDRYRATWWYVFEGGCVTYQFEAAGEGADLIPRQVEKQVSFVWRDAIDRHLRREHGAGL